MSSQFMSIEISDIYYVRVVRVSSVPFSPYTLETPLKIILVYSRYPGNLMFATVCVFNVSTRRCTIKNKMADVFLDTKVFRNTHTDRRAQQ